MAWETRTGSSNVYYVRSHEVGGRVYHEYCGAAGSPTAELAAVEDAMRREARERAALDRRTERGRLAELDAPVFALNDRGESLYRAVLVVAGYRRHDRRRRRRRA
jgi:hypothetical protein